MNFLWHTYLDEELQAHESVVPIVAPFIAQRGGDSIWLSFGAAFVAIFDGHM